MNAYVERRHRTIREEFYYSRDDLALTVSELRDYLRRDDYWYDWLRPHQALDNQPPMLKFLTDLRSSDAPLSDILDAPSFPSTTSVSHVVYQSQSRCARLMSYRGVRAARVFWWRRHGVPAGPRS